MKRTWHLKKDRKQYILELYQDGWLVERRYFENHQDAVAAGIAWQES